MPAIDIYIYTYEAHVCKKTKRHRSTTRDMLVVQKKIVVWKDGRFCGKVAWLIKDFRTVPPFSVCVHLCSAFFRLCLAVPDLVYHETHGKGRNLEKNAVSPKKRFFSKSDTQTVSQVCVCVYIYIYMHIIHAYVHVCIYV